MSASNAQTDFSDSFERALDKLSPRFYKRQVKRHHGPLPDQDPIKWLRSTFNASLAPLGLRHFATQQPVALWFDFIDEKSINACAFRDENLYCIAFHHLTVSGMLQIFGELLTHSDVFSEGDAKATAPTTDDLAAVYSADSKDFKVRVADLGVATTMPSNENRFRLATFLQRLALDLLYFHELNHLMLGHVGYSELRFGPCALFEVAGATGPAHVAQIELEFAADFCAGAALADCIAEHSFASAGKVARSQDPAICHQETLKLMELVLFAAAVTFVQFESQLLAQSLRGIAGYPLSETRWFSVLRGIERRLAKTHPHLAQELVPTVVPRVFQSLNAAFSESNLRDPLFAPIFVDKGRRDDAIDQMTILEGGLWESLETTREHALLQGENTSRILRFEE